jgi:RNA polymerase sigma-70 factor (ECF subfamily)
MVSTTAEGRADLALADRSRAEVVAMSEPTDQTGLEPADATVAPDWDAPSWDDVVRDHGARVYRLAYRLTGNQHDAEDLTQEVFVRVFRSLSQYTPGSFEGWLHRITTNLFLDGVRRKARIRFDGLPDDAADRIPSREIGPQQLLDDRAYDADVQDALDALHPDFRVAVVLCDVEGMTYEEISDLLGIKLGTVRSRIHRGRAALRQALSHRTPRTAVRFPLGHDPAGGTA